MTLEQDWHNLIKTLAGCRHPASSAKAGLALDTCRDAVLSFREKHRRLPKDKRSYLDRALRAIEVERAKLPSTKPYVQPKMITVFDLLATSRTAAEADGRQTTRSRR